MTLIHGRPHDQRMADDHKYESAPKQYQDELRTKFEVEFRDACLVIACIVGGACVFALSYWMGR